MHVPSGYWLPMLKEATSPTSAGVVVLGHLVTSSEDGSQEDHDVKNAIRYNSVVFEALSTLKDTNGSELDCLVIFID